MKNKMILIDGSNIMYRAYYGTAYNGNLMQNSKGQYTNAVYGFVMMMNTVLSEDFSHILVAFDKSGKTFRHDEFPDYKAGRKPMPEEFRSQIDLIKKSLDVLGVKQREIELIEADDIIGTYSHEYYDNFDEIVIISNDRDLLQLVNDKVHLRASKKGMANFIDYTKEYMEEHLGVRPDQIPDLKGLMGDASDNLPGIPGVGEKTAVKLLKQYDTLENIIAHKDDIKGKLGERIREHFQGALLCKKIATIKTDVRFHFSLNEIEYKGVKEEEMIAFYQELELHSLIKGFLKKRPQKINEITYEDLDNIIKIKEVLIDKSVIILEYFGKNYHKATPLGFAINNDLGSFFIPYHMLHMSIDLQLFLQDENMEKYVHDYKAMSVILKKDGIDLKGVRFDLLLAAYLLNPSNTKEDFRVIVSNFGYDQVPYYEEVYGKGKKYSIPMDDYFKKYAIQKAIAITSLKDTLLQSLNEYKQIELFENVELPLASVLAKMEFQGILVDRKMLDKMDVALKTRLSNLTDEIYSLAGETFNIQSPSQLGEILFVKLGLPNGKKTKTGYSTAVDVLEKIKGLHPIIDKVLQYRILSKLHGTYVVGLRDTIYEDGKIHTIYRQAFTSTGRLSSIEPNLQNIPIRYPEGRAIRKVFIPERSNVFLASDYSQIELRVLAHMAKEDVLIRAFKNNEDIHKKTAQLLFGKETITALERRQAKAVNFGILYGQSAWGLSEGIHVNPVEAKRFIERYFERFPGIKSFMENIVNEAQKNGYVKTIYNRRRYIPELKSSVHMQREAGKRNAMNAPIQGSAADIIKIAMVQLDKEITKQKLQSKMILQIHDELVIDVVEEEKEQIAALVKKVMENCVKLDVPLQVDSHFGKDLYELK
jgi:DNA polymerase-1